MKYRVAAALAVAFMCIGSVVFAQSSESRVTRFTMPITDTGLFLASCGDFDILYDDEALVHGVLVVGKEGENNNYIEIYRILGRTTYYNSLDPTKSVEGGPGEMQQTRRIFNDDGAQIGRNISGLIFKIVLPAYGPIFMETGQFRFRAGVLVFNSGFNQALDGDVNALCDYLR